MAKKRVYGGEDQRILARVSESAIVQRAKSVAADTKFVAKKLLYSTGRKAWYVGTTFIVLAVPLIIAMDREAQLNELEMQQANILGASPAPPSFK
ncbi:hypothetical protein L6164_025971 [Bauhinia variegata]|uniref:Uncharacterized protein n=1 Tax=Bauhinia variegata TaxID=167791 RepID=A0ACB9M2J8_BAUVA|nr:hypothetical protein L6164_025971 [Bauhinia variegata]